MTGKLLRRVLASDLVDRLCTPHGVDRYLEVIDPRWTVREPRGEIVGVQRRTDRSVTLTVEPNSAWAGFAAGQHVLIGVDIDGTIHRRTFSIASSPDDPSGNIELTIRARPEGRVGRHLHRSAAAGQVIRLSAATGDYVLAPPPERPERIILISGGSGITPNLSILRKLADDGYRGALEVLHYEQTPADLCYREELRDLVSRLPAARSSFVFTRERGAGDLDGHLSPEHLAHLGLGPHDPEGTVPEGHTEVYVCGPVPLLDSSRELLADMAPGVVLHQERFGLAPIDPSMLDADATVTFERSSVTAAAEGTVLETAEAAGLIPAFGCRRGVCGTCTTNKSAGRVRHLLTGDLSAPDDGAIRPCVSIPVGDVVVDL